MNRRQALLLAVDIVGSQSKLALLLGVKQQHVWNWINRDVNGVPGYFSIEIEEATHGKITRHDLRPDIFGDPPI